MSFFTVSAPVVYVRDNNASQVLYDIVRDWQGSVTHLVDDSDGTIVAEYSLEEALLVRYDLSLMDLKHLNWMLSYPPSPQMQEMKMFPPYEEVIANASQ